MKNERILSDDPDKNRSYFKYFSQKWALEFSNKMELFFSPIEEFNDPHDTPLHLIDIPTDLKETEIRRILKPILNREVYKVMKKKYMNSNNRRQFPLIIDDLLNITRTHSGVCCLSTELSSPVMWSHYTEHKGMAIEIKEPALDFPGDEEHIVGLLKMNYSDKPKMVSLRNGLNESLSEALCMKTSEWAYEKEYRLIVSGVQGTVSLVPSTLKSIYFGYKADDDFISSIYTNLYQFLKKRDSSMPNFYIMAPNRETFKLSANDIDIKFIQRHNT